MENTHTASSGSILVRRITAILLLIAVLPLPYGYYMLLRVVVFFVFGYYFFVLRKKHIDAKKELPVWVWAIAGFALLFNPFMPAHLLRPIWAIFNIVGAYVINKSIEWEVDL